MSNALGKVRWIKGKEQLSIISIEVMVQGKGGDERTEKGGIYT